MIYTVKNNESIIDVALNTTGSLTAWETISTLNGFSEWVPCLYNGQVIEVPEIINNSTQAQLDLYPINNYTSGIDLSSLIAEIENTLDSVVVEVFPEITQSDKQLLYVVKDGETISDVVMNTTGTIDNWETILTVNGFGEWVPQLTAGQQILISYLDLQQNNIFEFTKYPLCNNAPSDLNSQISELIINFENVILFDDELTEMEFDDELTTALYN